MRHRYIISIKFLFGGYAMVRKITLARRACVASILVPLMLPTNGSHADEVFTPAAAMALPAGNGCHYPPPYPSPAPCKPLQSRDIAYVDEATHTYVLADRSNAAIDVFDTLTNKFVRFLQPTDPFAGAQPTSVATGSGPNGVILLSGVILPPLLTARWAVSPGATGKR
jgi:hypothetical protein